MTKRVNSSIILLSIAFVGLASCTLSAFAPPKVTVTKEYISTNHSFINGVKIERLQVDSIGEKGYPVKYTTLYTTSCNIHHPKDKPPTPPIKIEFYKPGKYSWDEDTFKVRYLHNGLSRQSLDSTKEFLWLNKFGNYPICQLKFEHEQWYFITIGDPQVTGIFFYIDKDDKEQQYYLESGVSPI